MNCGLTGGSARARHRAWSNDEYVATAMAWGVAGIYVFPRRLDTSSGRHRNGYDLGVCLSRPCSGVMVGVAIAAVLWLADMAWVGLAVSSVARLLLAGLAGLSLGSDAARSPSFAPAIGNELARRDDLPPTIRRLLGRQ